MRSFRRGRLGGEGIESRNFKESCIIIELLYLKSSYKCQSNSSDNCEMPLEYLYWDASCFSFSSNKNVSSLNLSLKCFDFST